MGHYYEVRICLDQAHRPIGASVITQFDEGPLTVRPRAVGPFDTASEVLADLMGLLDEQGTLW